MGMVITTKHHFRHPLLLLLLSATKFCYCFQVRAQITSTLIDQRFFQNWVVRRLAIKKSSPSLWKKQKRLYTTPSNHCTMVFWAFQISLKCLSAENLQTILKKAGLLGKLGEHDKLFSFLPLKFDSFCAEFMIQDACETPAGTVSKVWKPSNGFYG
jgi:hypothetical protein